MEFLLFILEFLQPVEVHGPLNGVPGFLIGRRSFLNGILASLIGIPNSVIRFFDWRSWFRFCNGFSDQSSWLGFAFCALGVFAFMIDLSTDDYSRSLIAMLYNIYCSINACIYA